GRWLPGRPRLPARRFGPNSGEYQAFRLLLFVALLIVFLDPELHAAVQRRVEATVRRHLAAERAELRMPIGIQHVQALRMCWTHIQTRARRLDGNVEWSLDEDGGLGRLRD